METVSKGRYSFNAEYLAGLSVSEAVKAFGHIPSSIVKEAHKEASSLFKKSKK